MPTDPTTKSQVQAYRFMLRRMESALVRKDSVMTHEPMRNHLTATVVGLIVGVLGLAAFFVVGIFSPASQVRPGDIVAGKQSLALFVVQDQPRQLVPVLNLASARLLVAAFNHNGAEPPETKIVEDSALAGFNRARITGLAGAPDVLPSPENLIGGPWSVCDTADIPDGVPNAQARATLTTTALVGVDRPGTPLRPDQALLVQAPDGGPAYLVHDGHRSEVDLSQGSLVKAAYRLDGVTPRKVSLGLLNAIPPGRPLTLPDIPNASAPSQLAGVRIGDVVRVKLTETQFFLLLPQGKQRVSPAVADVIRYRDGGKEFTTVAPEDITRVPDAPASGGPDFSAFPPEVPQVLGLDASRNACLVWSSPDRTPVVTVSTDRDLPLGQGRRAVDVPGGGHGLIADRAFVTANKGALVRGVVPGQRPDQGAIWLVTYQGLRYGVPSLDVARALGLGATTTPAPESILGLLPIGPELDPQRALELFDPTLARQQQATR